MDILPQVQETIKRFGMFRPGDVVAVGVSGGPDSVALLDLLWRAKDDLRLRLYVAHLNHRLRAEAPREAEFVMGLAASYGLKAVTQEADVRSYAKEHRLSTEVAAREVRYRFFHSVLDRVGAVRMALGHQADDQAETVLLNIIRGAGLTGLKGIPPVRGPFVRPLIEVRRAAVESYCVFRGLKTCADTSNLSTEYLRNRIRHGLIPILEHGYNPAVVEALGRLADIAREEERFIADETSKFYDGITSVSEEGIDLDAAALAALPVALARRVVRSAYKTLSGGIGELDFPHTEKILDLLHSDAGREVVLPRGLRVARSYKTLSMIRGKRREIPDYCRSVSLPGATPIPELNATLEARVKTQGSDPSGLSPNEVLMDLDRLEPPLFARRRQPGDVFHPFGFRTPIKLKNFFIAQKIPRCYRDEIPLVIDASGIVWIGGVRVSARAAVTPETTRFLHLRLIYLTGEPFPFGQR
ncbi:MAG: tRNA lysidine(34) synthetase TilS [Bacillota bacterium]